MDLRSLRHLFTPKDIRNAVFATAVVVGGLCLAAVTVYAHQTQQPRLAGLAAGISLVFVLIILVFVVPPLARNAGKEASQMNLPFEFTTGGAIVVGLMMIVGFSAWNTGNNLLFLVLSFLAATLIVGFFAGGISLKKLDVKMRFPETIFAGEETPILVGIHNRKRIFPSFSVVVEVRGSEHDRSIVAGEVEKLFPAFIARRLAKAPIIRRTLNYFVFVPRNTTVEIRTEHIFPHRGRFLIKDFELSTGFPFGFFRHRKRLPAKETELIVFPVIGSIGPEYADLSLDAGRLAASRRGFGQDLLALRDYQPADDMRRVDWKATARSRGLIVREFSAEDEKRVTIFFDGRVPRSPTEASLRERIEAERSGKSTPISEQFEAGIRRTAAFLAHFTEEQAEIRLVVNGKVGEFGVGTDHLHESLRRLAAAEPVIEQNINTETITNSLQEHLDEADNSHSFLITTVPAAGISAEILLHTNLVNY